MTGREFCAILNIDHDKIVNERKADALDNFKFIIEQMSQFKEMKDTVVAKHREHITEDNFYSVDE